MPKSFHRLFLQVIFQDVWDNKAEFDSLKIGKNGY